ncbi:hypothetical protein FACS1894130_03240 [Spirochaetia bacterium]|nr:hypothetical protein FACS1894130_03240 [Spirochaetia bacterium]
MMKKFLWCIILCYGVLSPLFSQDGGEIEKLALIRGFTRSPGKAGAPDGPNLIVVDEAAQTITIPGGTGGSSITAEYSEPGNGSTGVWETRPGSPALTDGGAAIRIGPWLITAVPPSLNIVRDNKTVARLPADQAASGISFILKTGTYGEAPPGDGENYAVFFVNPEGQVGALDTRGRVYCRQEAIALLRRLESEKFQASRIRANRLGLEPQFLNGDALVWDQTWYAAAPALECYWGKTVYPMGDGQIRYDLQGNGYQLYINHQNNSTAVSVWIIDPDGNRIKHLDLTAASDILKTSGLDRDCTIAFHVDFGGNIYYFVSGDEYTELFRIRRTWGAADMYALAINGYTRGTYGTWVRQVFSRMNTAELTILKQYLYAIYGAAFPETEIQHFFEKQIWYAAKNGIDPQKITLPVFRQELLNLILEEEHKR